MGFSSVFKWLQEIFPEVDARLLRAVAIEHPKDADHAVEVVLTEVLPYILKRPNSSSSQENQCSLDPNVEHAEEDVEQDNSSIHRLVQRSMSSEDNQVFMAVSKSNDDITDANLTGNATDSTSLDSTRNDCVVFDEDDKSISFGQVEVNDDVGLDHVANIDTESIALSPMQKSEEVSIECGTEETADINATISVREDENTTKVHDLNLEDVDGPGAQNVSARQLKSCLARSQMTENDMFERIDPTGDTQSLISDCEKGSLCFNSCQDCSDAVVVNYEDDSALVSRSGQICSVDSLEGIIEDAKSSKKSLVSVKESIINLMKKVKVQEKAAEQAKEEAAKGGSLILMKVEELKKMLVHAKEANDMHGGEVYGEKAILATEARELQSRLLSLSRERDISLAILNDIRETLESRLSSAKEVIRAALSEKEEKEARAQNALSEQEAIMEKVVQESKILQQEAEENSKLQEFLMDRGHVVDMLQGEISVICQDVRLLKEKFDKRVPFTDSVTSSQSTCIVASSSSSLKSVSSDLDIERSSSKMLNKTSPTTSIINGESPKSSTTSTINGESPKGVSDEDRPKNDHTTLVDDEWN